MISKLSNHELDANLKRLVGSERKILHSILEHINEVATRQLYLEKAHSSLYEYLVKECHYSGSAAMRRIAAAKLLKEVPVVSEKIQSGVLNLSQIGELARAIKEKENTGVQVSSLQKEKLLAVISGKSTVETQKEISKGLDLDLKIPEKKFVQKDDSVRVELTLTASQYQKLLNCKDLAAHSLLSESSDISLAAVIERLANHYLSQKTKPSAAEEIQDRSMLKDWKRGTDTSIPRTSEKVVNKLGGKSGRKTAKNNEPEKPKSTNKTLTPKTRKEILARDKCCQYKDLTTGKICGSTFGLEVDHIKPQWASGDHSSENLQTLCRAHNIYKYQRQANLKII